MVNKISRNLLMIVFLVCAMRAMPARADPLDLIDEAFIQSLKDKFSSPLVRQMVTWQNRYTAHLNASDITKLDRQWMEEREGKDKSLIVATLSNPLSIYLLQIQAASSGLYSEIFIMDSKGLNVGQSTVTSDYWQGDEAKYLETFPAAKSGLFIDDPVIDLVDGTSRVQVSFPLHDEHGGEKVGVATIEINLDTLARRQPPAF
ncbi:PDC sensor domain-containing protein [Roseibium algae]|uniref:PDC sensor domain-containing protein n=1 Tax=Roseibium algae TaxID=3123038 RepID=A0ABU8TIA0_9HYPH